MTRRRPIRERKRPVFFGCEGESEVAYGQVLNDLLQSVGLPVHLQVDSLAPGAGDPLARVKRSLQRIKFFENRRAKFQLKTIIMDSDQTEDAPQRAEEAKQLARQHNIGIIWQKPCHEALLLRHMPDCSNRRPQSSRAALEALRQVWFEYEKPMTRAQLAQRINLEAILRAAGVERDLQKFLKEIGLN